MWWKHLESQSVKQQHDSELRREAAWNQTPDGGARLHVEWLFSSGSSNSDTQASCGGFNDVTAKRSSSYVFSKVPERPTEIKSAGNHRHVATSLRPWLIYFLSKLWRSEVRVSLTGWCFTSSNRNNTSLTWSLDVKETNWARAALKITKERKPCCSIAVWCSCNSLSSSLPEGSSSVFTDWSLLNISVIVGFL